MEKEEEKYDDGRNSDNDAEERDWRIGGNEAEQGNRNPTDVSYGLLQNLWLSQLVEKHNQVPVK